MEGKSKSSRRKPPVDIVKKTAGMWKIKETGSEYTKRLRKEWESRGKRLNERK